MRRTGRLLLLQAVALGAGLLTQANADSTGRPFQQTPAYVQAAFKLGQQQRTPLLGSSKWESLGPDRTTPQWAAASGLPWQVDSGRVRGMLQDPERLNRVFVLFGGGGLWRTDNFYATPTGSPGDTKWKPLTDRIPNNGGAISFGCNSNILYYAIGDFDSSLYPTNNPATSVSGVLVKSLDGGDTWQAPAIIGQYVSIIWDLDVIPGPAKDGSRDTVIVATDAGLFVSQDGGKTFKQVLPVDPKPPTGDLFNPTAITSVARTSAGWVAVGWLQQGGVTNTGVFLSENGVHWDPTPVFRFPTTQRVTLAQAVHNDPRESVVFALVAASDGNGWVGVFRSDNGGRSFSALNVVLPTKTFAAPSNATTSRVMDCIGGQSFYNQALLVDPSDRSRNTFIWAGAYASLKTTDSGETLTLTSAWYTGRGWGCDGAEAVSYVHADAHAAIALKRPPGVTPKPHKGTTNTNRQPAAGGAPNRGAAKPLKPPPGIRTRQGLQDWLARQQPPDNMATGLHQAAPGAVVSAAGGATAGAASRKLTARVVPNPGSSQLGTPKHAFASGDEQHLPSNEFPHTEQEMPHPHADHSPYQSLSRRHEGPSRHAPGSPAKDHTTDNAYEEPSNWPVYQPHWQHPGQYPANPSPANKPTGHNRPRGGDAQPGYAPHYPRQPKDNTYPPSYYPQQPRSEHGSSSPNYPQQPKGDSSPGPYSPDQPWDKKDSNAPSYPHQPKPDTQPPTHYPHQPKPGSNPPHQPWDKEDSNAPSYPHKPKGDSKPPAYPQQPKHDSQPPIDYPQQPKPDSHPDSHLSYPQQPKEDDSFPPHYPHHPRQPNHDKQPPIYYPHPPKEDSNAPSYPHQHDSDDNSYPVQPPYHYPQRPEEQEEEDESAVYDILLGTDGGLFFSSDGGLSYDDGMLNNGISTKLANYVVGTTLNRDMLVIGLQDNGSRLRIGTSTAWEEVDGGDGQSQFLSQAALDTSAAGYASITNWYTYGGHLPFSQLDEAQRTGNASVLVSYQELNGGEALIGSQDMDGTFGIPSPSVDPTGQIVFTRKGCCGLYMSTDSGLTWRVVHSFASPNRELEEGAGEEGDVRIDLFVASRFHNIAVAAGREEGTMSVAVIRPLNVFINSNEVEVTGLQNTTQGAAEATWTSATLETIAGWVDERLYLGTTTTSSAWRDNTRVFVSSVALPSPELPSPRPRIAYADVTDAGIQNFTACAAAGLPDTPVLRVVVEGDYILAATWHGVYASTDDCATFAQLGSSLPNVQVRDLYVLPADGQQPRMLLAATYGRGVWRLPLP